MERGTYKRAHGPNGARRELYAVVQKLPVMRWAWALSRRRSKYCYMGHGFEKDRIGPAPIGLDSY